MRKFLITLLLLMIAGAAYSQDINKKTAEQKPVLSIEKKDGDFLGEVKGLGFGSDLKFSRMTTGEVKCGFA